MEENAQNNQNIYQCTECGLHYRDSIAVENCKAWCKNHKTCNVEITKLSEENKTMELEKKCEEYLNNWKRERADFLNYKRDEAERIAFLVKYAKEDIILKLLPIVDNIELAEKQLPKNLREGKEGTPQAIEWTKGFLQIQNQIKNFLKKERINEVKTIGEKFNPETMEIVGEAEGGESGTVAEEIQKGYMADSKIIRPAKVKVSR